MIALHEEDPALSGGGVMHEGIVSTQIGLEGVPSISESTMIARDALIAEHEHARVHFQHLSARGSVEALAAARARGRERQRRGHAAPPAADRRARPLARHEPQDQPAAAHRGRPPGARSKRCATARSNASPPTTRRTRARRRTSRSSWRRSGSTGLESAFAVLHTELVLPGILTLAVLLERLTAGARLLGLPVPAIEAGAPANLCLIDLDARWRIGEAGYESRSANCAFAGREVSGRVLLTLAGGVVAYRERAFALSAA